jgi:hypothetical protein
LIPTVPIAIGITLRLALTFYGQGLNAIVDSVCYATFNKLMTCR